MADGRTFLLMGSGEFEPWSEEVEGAALQGARGDGTVAIVPAASFPDGQAIFDRWGAMGLEHYEAMGVPARIVPLRDRADAMREEFAGQVADASMVFFSGGKPRYLAEAIGGTPFWDGLLTRSTAAPSSPDVAPARWSQATHPMGRSGWAARGCSAWA